MGSSLLSDIDGASAELIEESCREGDKSVPNLLELGHKLYFGATWKNR